MLSAFKQLFSPPPYQQEAPRLYTALVAQARKPVFYTQCGVPDTLDGRFDVIVLHLWMLIDRLRREPSHETDLFARAVQEAFFADMDRSVREMGVSDTGVGKRIKNMAQAFYGRMQAYDKRMEEGALTHNLYRGQAPTASALTYMTGYLARNRDALAGTALSEFLAGNLIFLD